MWNTLRIEGIVKGLLARGWNCGLLQTDRTVRAEVQGRKCQERARGNIGGFSLLEVMVALAIRATALTAVLKLHSDAMDMVIAGRTHTQGAELAQYKLTEIELAGLEGLALQSGEFGEIAPQYAWDVTVEPTPLESWSKVTVTVNNIHLRSGDEFRLTTYLLKSKPDEEEKEALEQE